MSQNIIAIVLSDRLVFGSLWLFWGLQFALLEYLAIRREIQNPNPDKPNDGNTLSEFMWRFIKVHPLIYMFMTAALIWLTVHILTGRI